MDLKNQIDAGKQKLVSDEDFLFYQYHMFIVDEKFTNVYDQTNPAFKEEKENCYRTSIQLLNYNCDVATIIKSINSFEFLSYKFCFNEPQFYIYYYLCKQTFFGEYMIGFPIDDFQSHIYNKETFQENLNNFKRAIQNFRSNKKFVNYDEKIIRHLAYFSSNISAVKFLNNLKGYYKLKEDFSLYQHKKKSKK